MDNDLVTTEDHREKRHTFFLNVTTKQSKMHYNRFSKLTPTNKYETKNIKL